MRSKSVTLLLCAFLGMFGIHRFYLGKVGTGILWLLTCGCFGIGSFIDFILICANNLKDSNGQELKRDVSPGTVAVLMLPLVIVVAFCFGAVANSGTSETINEGYMTDYSYNESVVDSQDNKVNYSEDIPQDVEYIQATVDGIYNELDSNAARAEQLEGQYLLLTGILSGIDSDGKYFSLRGYSDDIFYSTVHCSITNRAQVDAIMKYNRDDEITIKCKVTDVGEIIGYFVDVIEVQ